jgi:hypothetical protein
MRYTKELQAAAADVIRRAQIADLDPRALEAWDGELLGFHPELPHSSATLSVAIENSRRVAREGNWALDLGSYSCVVRRQTAAALANAFREAAIEPELRPVDDDWRELKMSRLK